MLALAMTLLMSAPALAADCGCATTGPYKSPASKDLQIPTAEGLSPQGKYRVSATGSAQINLTIRRVSTNAVVYSSTLPGGSQWGFSPDADRFVYHYVRSGVHTVVLIDLTRTTQQQRWTTSIGTSSSRIRFSPNGRYLLYSAVTGPSHVYLQVVDAVTGQRRYETEFTFSNIPGSPGDSFGMANWGFSPDSADGTFVFAWVSGQFSVELNMVNLASGTVVHNTTLITASAFWQFSPCGDVIAIVQQTSPTFQSARTLRTSTGALLRSQDGIPLASLALSATTTQHQAVVNGTVYPLGANTAGAACSTPAVAESLTVAPASVVGGAANATGTVRLNQTPSSTTPVTLSSSDTSAATVLASVNTTTQQKTFTVTSRAVTTTKNVTITATAGGVSKTAQLTVTPPAPTARTVSDITFTPASVQGGDASTGRVTLSSAAPTGGLDVTLESLDPAATVTPSVRVPGNATSATFAVATSPVASQVDAAIRASLGTSSSLTRTLTITTTPSGGANAVLRDGNCLANVLPANDDGSTNLLALPTALNFFGSEYDQLFVNNNGNVTFDERLGTYTPFDLTSTSRVIIAPFFADVDTRGTGSGLVTWGTTELNGRTTFCANWTGTSYDGVGYYSGHTDKRNTFQLLLIDRADTGPGNFDIEFRYDKVQWETGDASGGSNGLGGNTARAGYSNGDPSAPGAAFELPGSAVGGAFLDGAPTALTRNSRNAQENGRYVFPVRNGAPPTGGRIAGRILGPDGTLLRAAPVQACAVDQPSACVIGRSNSAGAYALAGLSDGDYTVTAFPPAGSALARRSIGPLPVDADTNLTGQDIALTGPTGLPTGTTITPSTTNGQGIPSVYWHSSLTLSTTGCPGGTATYDIRRDGTSTESGPLIEGAPGEYSGTIPPLAPATGIVDVHIAIDCPDPAPDETVDFNIYIDPSGNVRSVAGDALADATVTLLRSDSPSGPFEQVPDGSEIMSPANRQNPDTTDAAGHFGWDVIAGYYRVRAERAGCVSPDDPSQEYVESAVMEIPPPVTDLDLRLECPSANDTPPVTTAPGPAVVRSSTTWLLRDSLTSGDPTTTFSLGTRPLVPFTGDWDGNGSQTPGTYSGGVLRLYDQIPPEASPTEITFGDPRGFPVAGEFDGDGRDDVAIYRNGTWQIRFADDGVTSTVSFGSGSWPSTVPVAADWDGDGTDGIGTYTLANGTWNLRQTASSGSPDAGTFVFWTGPGSYPVVGDWDADATDTVGVKNGTTWSLNDQNDISAADITFQYGLANDLPLSWTRGPDSSASSR